MDFDARESYGKHKGKILPTSVVGVGLAMILFFWNLDVSRGDIRKIPDTRERVLLMEQTTASLMTELKEAEIERQEQGKEIAALLAQMRIVLDAMETSQADIKRLLER